MFSSRTFATALALLALLAILVPPAMAQPAAPDTVHEPVIIAPTTAAPTYAIPEVPDGVKIHCDVPETLHVDYKVHVVNIQTQNIEFRFRLIDQVGEPLYSQQVEFEVAPIDLPAKDADGFMNWVGCDGLHWLFDGRDVDDGWYDLQLCVRDDTEDPEAGWDWCTTQTKAVLLSDEYPTVDLEKPGVEKDEPGRAFVTGQQYKMVGFAYDKFGIDHVTFQFCDESNDDDEHHKCRRDSPSWVWIADGVADYTSGKAGQWTGTWDSTQVVDGWGRIRMCAYNLVGLSNCDRVILDEPWEVRDDDHRVWVVNHFKMDLEPGWNLISLPFIPYNPNIVGDPQNTGILGVLDHPNTHHLVRQVVQFVWNNGTLTPQVWNPPWRGGPQDFTVMRDGRGYWVEMIGEWELELAGTFQAFPPMGPPEYGVRAGWNLIGYTQFGEPWFFAPKLAMDYVGPAFEHFQNVQAIWRYDPIHEVFEEVTALDPMIVGLGYWLGITKDGTIRP